MEFLVVLAVLTLVVLVVSAPLRREALPAGRQNSQRETTAAGVPRELAELEAAREAKYREIRDAELDHRTGKLSDADFEAVDETLRAEAIEILDALDAARERAAATIAQR